jgi:DNA polymerase III alpha subunit
VPYFTAVLNAGGGYYELPVYIEEAKRNGIRILPPDVNRSGREFEVEGGDAIRVGLGSIKGLPEKAIARLLEERGSAPFASVGDALARLKPGKAELLALIRAGAFDSLEPRRTRQILRYFQGLDDMTEVADISGAEKRRLLYEALGFLPEGDVLELYEGPRPDLRIRDLGRHAGAAVELVVRVLDARERGTNGRAKHFYLFEDETGLLEGIGERRCVVYGTPPVCFLRGEIRRGGEGIPKVFNCEFLRGF